MPRGIDIYRYQTVTDWAAVKRSGVAFAWVKLTDGFGPAIVRGDRQVTGAKSAGIPVGGYHFAQKGDPRAQARVFLGELDRLGAWGIVPALDIENNGPLRWTGPQAHDFAVAFLGELRRRVSRVALYANTSELAAMRAAEIVARVPGTVIWEANYGNNNGTRHTLPTSPWAPHRAAHQYTSRGRIPGITEHTDLNESLMDLTLTEDDMQWTDVETHGRTGLRMPIGDWIGEIKNDTSVISAVVRELAELIPGLFTKLDAGLVAEIRKVDGTPSDVQVDALARQLTASLGPAVAGELGRRLTE